MQSLNKIGSIIGIPLKTDRYTKDKSMVKYARLMVEMPLEGNFPDYIEFVSERDVIIRQRIVNEWRPIKCTHCKMFGHTHEECRKKVNQRQEWRAIPHETAVMQQQPDTGEPDVTEGFQPVTKSQHSNRIATQMRTLAPIIETLMANSFDALLDAEMDQEIGRGGGYDPNG